jgi:signal transduction histidine kinase
VPIPRLLKTASFRLTAIYGAALLASFALLLFFTYLTLTSALREQIKDKIAENIQALSGEAASDGVTSIIQDINERLTTSTNRADYYFLADATGAKIAGNLDRLEPMEGWHELALDAVTGQKPIAAADIDDLELWGQGKRLPGGDFLFVGQDVSNVLATQRTIITSFAWAAGIALLLAALVGLVLSRGFLRRIDAINETSQAIMAGKLKSRIPVSGTADEIDRLSANLNRLFDSNQALMEGLKHQGTSIAHDLRTPLSRLRQSLEEARMHKRSAAYYKQAIDAAVAESDQLLATFTALLRIAQIEAGSRKAGFTRVDLCPLLQRVAEAYAPVAEDEGKELAVHAASGIEVNGDSDLLLQMFSNLVENAIRHTPRGARIAIDLAAKDAGAVAVVADNGPGIPDAHREKVFERFFRLDRSRTTPGNGLGLALVAAVAEIHGVRLSLHDNRPGLRTVLAFPAYAAQT